MTPFQDHVQRWKGCTKCPLHTGRNKVVFCRGKLPCDILFTGEAPGKSENLHGQPFYGPAGDLLDDLVFHSVEKFCICPHEDCTETPFISNHRKKEMTCCPECGRHQSPQGYRTAFANLVCCLPLGENNKVVPPDEVAIQACAERLVEFVQIAQPKLIVCVGSIAAKWLDPRRHVLKRNQHLVIPSTIPRVSIVHPSAMLAMNEVIATATRRRSIITISNAVEKYLMNGEKEEPEYIGPSGLPPTVNDDGQIPF